MVDKVIDISSKFNKSSSISSIDKIKIVKDKVQKPKVVSLRSYKEKCKEQLESDLTEQIDSMDLTALEHLQDIFRERALNDPNIMEIMRASFLSNIVKYFNDILMLSESPYDDVFDLLVDYADREEEFFSSDGMFLFFLEDFLDDQIYLFQEEDSLHVIANLLYFVGILSSCNSVEEGAAIMQGDRKANLYNMSGRMAFLLLIDKFSI